MGSCTDDDRAIWTYWEDPPGGSRPAYLDLCLETIRAHSEELEVRVLGRADSARWLPEMDVERWELLPAPNYRSDYVRSRVLQRYGGIWADIDTIVIGALPDLLIEVDDESRVVCWGRELGRCFTNLCGAAPGSSFVDAWVEEQDNVLDSSSDWSLLGYSALAQDVTWHMSRRFPWKALPMERLAPVPWYQWRRFFSRTESPRRLLSGSPLTIVLWNAVMAPRLRHFQREDLLRGRILLSRLLRVALGMSEADEEEGGWARLHSLSSMRFSTFGQRVEMAARRGIRRGPG